MFRAISYLLFTVIIITVLRGIIGIIAKAFTGLSNPPPAQRQQNPPRDNQVPMGGELKKDPACGTYIATATSLKENVGGETFYFCSKQCRDKYVASLAR